MKYSLALLGAVVLLLSACSVTKQYITFERTAAVAIEKSVQNIHIPEKIAPYINSADKIAFVSLEDATTGDDELTAVIEDAVLKQLVDNGVAVLDRDFDLLLRGSLESTAQPERIVLAESGAPLAVSLPKDFAQADKLVAYRVKELGVTYQQDGKDIVRKARAILTLRVIDCADNRIIYADTCEGHFQDTVGLAEMDTLEKLHYRNFSYRYPKNNTNTPCTNICETPKK